MADNEKKILNDEELKQVTGGGVEIGSDVDELVVKELKEAGEIVVKEAEAAPAAPAVPAAPGYDAEVAPAAPGAVL